MQQPHPTDNKHSSVEHVAKVLGECRDEIQQWRVSYLTYTELLQKRR